MYNVAAMPAEPPPEHRASAGEPSPAPPSVIHSSSVPPETELQLNSPTPLTLRLLGVIFLGTFLPWVAAKIACNEREGPIRVPPALATETLSKQPKDAAIELAQRAATGQYAAAAELAKGELAQQLAAEQAHCQAEPKACEARRAAQEHIFTRGVLVRRGPNDADVRVESVGGPQPERFLLHLEADGGRWFATTRSPFVGEVTEPTAPPAPAPTSGAAGSAAESAVTLSLPRPPPSLWAPAKPVAPTPGSAPASPATPPPASSPAETPAAAKL